MSALIIVLPKNSLEFSKYVLQNDEFSKCFFNMDEFSLGPVFLELHHQHFSTILQGYFLTNISLKSLFKSVEIIIFAFTSITYQQVHSRSLRTMSAIPLGKKPLECFYEVRQEKIKVMNKKMCPAILNLSHAFSSHFFKPPW